MIIKIIPEENENIKAVEHHNVKEFFIFGNKKDQDGDLIDFHDWSGAYRYLIGSLHYFVDQIKSEESSKMGAGRMEIPPMPGVPPMPGFQIDKDDIDESIRPYVGGGTKDGSEGGMIKTMAVDQPNLKVINAEDDGSLFVEEEEPVEEAIEAMDSPDEENEIELNNDKKDD